MIKNIIFDLAGVVLNLNLERDMKALSDAGLPDFKGCVENPQIAGAMMPYLNGLCSETEFLDNIRPFCKPDANNAEILWAMDAVLDDIPRSRLSKIVELKSRYKVYLLSNIYDKAWQHALRMFEVAGYKTEECFDELFLSYEMSLAKPDPKIYLAVFNATGTKPEETVYFDDSKDNIEMGKKLGMDSRLVKMNCLEDYWGDL